jgi:hypothetical protein
MLWGRHSELDLLKEALGQRLPPLSASRLYLVSGAPGIGKSAVITSLSAYLRGLPRAQILLQPTGLAEAPAGGAGDLLLAGISCLGVDAPEVYEGESFEAYWPRLLRETLPEMPVVVLIVDGYDRLAAEHRAFIRDCVFAPLKEFALSHDSRFLLSMASALTVSELSVFWSGVEVLPVSLKPLGDNALREWLREAKEPIEQLPELMAKTEGVPARVCEYLGEQRLRRLQAQAARARQEILPGLGEREIKILQVATLAESFDEELLDRFVGEGGAALLWLMQFDRVAVAQEGKHCYRLLPTSAELLRAWISQEDAAAVGELRRRLEGWQLILRHFGSGRERRLLGQLSLLRYISAKLIELLYPQESDEVLRYVHSRPEVFLPQGELWTISPAYETAARMASELLPQAERQSIQAKVCQLWQHKREELMAEIESEEKALVGQREQLLKTNSELERLEPELAQLNSKLERYRAPQPPTSIDGIQEGWNVAGLFLVLVGVVWIYVGVLSPQGVSLLQGLAGGFLILVGLGAPQMGRRHATVVAAIALPVELPPEASAVHKDRHFLRMRASALEQQKQSLTARISSKRKLIADLEGLLERPYL